MWLSLWEDSWNGKNKDEGNDRQKMITIDRLCYNSKLRYINAGEKFAFAVLALCACVISRSAEVSCFVLAVMGILSVWKGGIPFSCYLRYLSVPLIFLLLSSLAIVVNVSRTPLDFFAVSIGGFYITGSRASLVYASELILTALSSVSCLYFLSFHTPVPDILNVLRRLHCPKLILELMLLIYRFIFVLFEAAHSIRVSQNSRLGNRNYKTSVKSFSAMASALFIRAMKKSDALYNAMEARCYNGDIRVLNENFPPRRREIVWICIFEAVLYGFVIIEKL